MKLLFSLLFVLCFASPANAETVEDAKIQVPSERQLMGVTAEEASLLISKIIDAQERLKAGEFQPFRLLSGSIASSSQVEISPREAFLGVPFEDVWEVKRVPNGSKISRQFRLAYAPDGLGKLYWDIEVILGFDGNLERVTMTYRPPAPF